MIFIEPGSSTPLVNQIYEAIAAKIENGTLGAGTRLPSVRKLAKQCSVSTLTVTNAYNRLVAEAFLEARRASGYFVCAKVAPKTARRSRPVADLSVDSLWLLKTIYEDDSALVKAGCGWLPESYLYIDGIKHSLSAVAKKPASFASYGNPFGYTPLREQIRVSLAMRGIETHPEQIVLTHGATGALDIVARVLLEPSDVALVEDPGYCNLFPLLEAMGV